jgi:membrane associated rhomboid family serine protease
MSEFRFTRPDRFPPVIKNLLIINILVFIAQETIGKTSGVVENLFALHDIHSDISNLTSYLPTCFCMVVLIIFYSICLPYGCLAVTLENYWGSKRFLTFYILCGIGAGLLHLGVLYFEMDHYFAIFKFYSPEDQAIITQMINSPTVGASGAIFGCLVAFGYLFPNSLIYIYFLFPIKAKWFVIIYGAIELAWLCAILQATTLHILHTSGVPLPGLLSC